MRIRRLTIWKLMLAIAAVALSLVAYRVVLRTLRPRPGGYHGRYWYIDQDWHYHEVRGAVIFVREDGIIFSD